MLYLSRDVCWLALCQVDTNRMILQEGISVVKNAPTRLPCRQACDAFSRLIIDVGGSNSVAPSLSSDPGC